MMTSKTEALYSSNIKKEKLINSAELILTVLVLIVVGLTGYANLFLEPNLGFSTNINTGEITSLDSYSEQYLEITDRIIQANGIPVAEINNKVQNNPFLQTKEGEIIQLTVLREGNEIEIEYKKPPQATKLASDIIFSDWILPIPFFTAGLITALFVRPRTKTRTLLLIFFYTYAIWIGAGTISDTGYFYSPLIMRLFVWISIPSNFLLHWNFPKPFKPLKKWISISILSVFILIALLDFLGLLPSNLYFIGFLLSTICSLVILFVKFIKFREIRKIMRFLLLAYILALLPIVITIFLFILRLPTGGNISLLGLTAIPGFYFFSAYQVHLNRKIRNINLTMRLYAFGIILEFILFFVYSFIPKDSYNPLFINFISFLMIVFIMLTGFGILLIMPALADDQADLFNSKTYSLRMSANRAAAIINYLIALVPVILISILLIPGTNTLSFNVLILIILSNLFFVGISVFVYQKYKMIFERLVLGIKHPPEELIRNYAHRITTSLDLQALADLLKKEVLPSLLIRESILCYFVGSIKINKLFSTGIKDEDQEIIDFLNITTYAPTQDFQITLRNAIPWVRFALPLQIESDIIGLWIFGRKDPDDIYDQELIKDLQSLANQTTLALLNIRQRALLQSLYKSNVDRQEEQKASVARDLHDALLPSISYLVELQSNNCDPLEFEDAVQGVNNMVREIMSGLRPSSLDMGLNIALEELADEPQSQIGGKLLIHTDLKMPSVPIYYDKDVELHLYRMVQQACRNALEHAHASAVQIRGTLSEDVIDLVVEDDGIGFPFNKLPDLGQLIIDHHFGLANILERAKIIHADVKIESITPKGTRVHFYWPTQRDIQLK